MPYIITASRPTRRKRKNLPRGVAFRDTESGRKGGRFTTAFLGRFADKGPIGKWDPLKKRVKAYPTKAYKAKKRAWGIAHRAKKRRARVTPMPKKGRSRVKKAASNPPRRRKNARRRARVIYRNRPRKAARRNKARRSFRRNRVHKGRYRRNPGMGAGVMSNLRKLWSLSTWSDVGLGLAGVSVAVMAPRAAAQYIHPSLGRGYGAVASSAASTALVSGLVSQLNADAGRAMFKGGMIATGAMLAFAVFGPAAKAALPIDEALIQSTLPTMSPAAAAGPSEGQIVAEIARRTGQAGLGRSSASINAGEAAYRRALGMRDYVSGPARAGVRDYPKTGGANRMASSFRGPEQF